MRIAIVGSRTFPQPKLVEWFVADLPLGVTIVSGGAIGVDSVAVEAARRRGMETRVHLPNLEGCTARHEFTERYYARNETIAKDADLLVAFTEKENGGTWDSIKRAKKLGVPVKIIKPAAFFPGAAEADEELPDDELTESPQQSARAANKGKGPFAIKRVSLGSYALRRKCYITAEEWAQFVVDKDSNPDALAQRMILDFLRFFAANKRLGFIHAISVPPRSLRNLGRTHVMDLVGAAVASELGVDFVTLFEPWNKTTRGRHAKHGEIQVRPEVKNLVGRVVWILDDVTTTNFTLASAVQSLLALEIHAHGLCYVVMS